jgi:hypothetical protein
MAVAKIRIIFGLDSSANTYVVGENPTNWLSKIVWPAIVEPDDTDVFKLDKADV